MVFGTCGEAYSLLRRNPLLRRAIFSAGLLVSVLSIGSPLILNELKSDVWGKRMSSNSAVVYTATGITSLLLGSMFGKWSDRVDRRLAYAMVGFLNFLPWYALLLFGANERGLVVSSLFTVVAGVTCMTPTGCPMIFTLANDLVPEGDREVAFGVSYCLVFVIAIFSTFGGVSVASAYPGDSNPLLAYLATLSVAFFAVVGTLRMPREDGHAATKLPSSDGDCSAGEQPSHTLEGPCMWPLEEPVPTCIELEPSRLAADNPDLWNLCVVAGLLCMPEIVLGDMTQQFNYEVLGLLKPGEGARKQAVTASFVYPGMLASLPAYFFLGVFAKRLGALRLMQRMIPATALLQTVPSLLMVFPEPWFIPVAGICYALSCTVLTPLQTVNAELAPKAAVGEAMALVGVSKQCASVCGNLLVFFLTPILQSTGMQNPLWVFYPLAACVALSSYPFAARIRGVKRMEAASSDEQSSE